jgi:hypothetical protein
MFALIESSELFIYLRKLRLNKNFALFLKSTIISNRIHQMFMLFDT